MAIFLCINYILLLSSFICLPISAPFTVIMSNSGTPVPNQHVNGAKTDTHEQEAVYEVMRATGNEWATTIPDVCSARWHGIECMIDKNNVFHVVALSFGSLSDDTEFPACDPTRSFISPSITKLPHLKTLFFYRCFTNNPQPIPGFLGQLGPTLQTLVLRENGNVGPIPFELGNLTRLRVLDLHKNNLNGSIPVSLGRITGLMSLDLSDNRLTGSIPSQTFPFLKILNLNQNHLNGSIPSTIGSCGSLIKLDLSRNRLDGSIPDSINELKNLMLIDFSYNTLSGHLELPRLNSLQALILNGNPFISSTIPTNGFDNLSGLAILILSDMSLQGPIPDSLALLPNLRVLRLDGNNLNESIPYSFRSLNRINELRLNNNQLTGPVPFGREMVWRMKRKLRLEKNSGLCYDERNGSSDDLSLLFDSGIGHCNGDPRSGSGKAVKHLSTIRGDLTRSSNKSVRVVDPLSIMGRLVQITTTLLFVFSLL